MTDKVLAYCEAIHTQDSEAFKDLWSRKSDCTLISIGTVFRGYNIDLRRFPDQRDQSEL